MPLQFLAVALHPFHFYEIYWSTLPILTPWNMEKDNKTNVKNDSKPRTLINTVTRLVLQSNEYQASESGISTYAWILSFLAVFQNKRDLKCYFVDTLLPKNTKLWSFFIKFGELRCKNVSNTFIIKRGICLKRLSAMRTLYIIWFWGF